jgi:hypothetical protein
MDTTVDGQEPGQPSRYRDWLRAGRPRVSEFESRWGQEFSLLHVVQTGSGAHPASYRMGTVSSLSGGKAAGACTCPLTSN